ncbi:MAG TPA: hypothetical protein VEW48_26395 [Thermoanaerobaculia bacterium]|nr:hypothetical protein [Thermoanaerobaculia bacterium]
MCRKLVPSFCLAVTLAACGSINQHQKLEQPTNAELRTYIGGTILKITETEDLPNAFGRKDVWGGKRPTGSTELKYLGLAESGKIKLRVISTDITTNENWRRRLRREGYATSTSDAVDFEQDSQEAFMMNEYSVEFVEAQASTLRFRITKPGEGGA